MSRKYFFSRISHVPTTRTFDQSFMSSSPPRIGEEDGERCKNEEELEEEEEAAQRKQEGERRLEHCLCSVSEVMDCCWLELQRLFHSTLTASSSCPVSLLSLSPPSLGLPMTLLLLLDLVSLSSLIPLLSFTLEAK